MDRQDERKAARGPVPVSLDPHDGVKLVNTKAAAVKAKPILLPLNATADEAFRLTLQHCKTHIAANVPAVVEVRAVEGVHQLRVALRRLRVGLAAFGKEFRTPPIEALRVRAKILAQGLAPARDLDVFMDELFEPAAHANGSLDAFAVLRARADAARRQAWAAAVREASGLAFRTFLHDLGEAVDGRVWHESSHTAQPAMRLFVRDAPAVDLASRMLTRRLKAAKKAARKLKTLSDADRHKLRIALKKLRYTAEFFAPLYPPRSVRPFLARLSKMQDILGHLQDVAVAHKILTQLVAEPEETSHGPRADLTFAAGIVYGWHLDRANSAWDDAMRRWKKFVQTKPFWMAI